MGPGETKLKQNIKAAAAMGEATFEDVPYGAVVAEEFGGDEGNDWDWENDWNYVGSKHHY